MNTRILRSSSDKMLGGVCGGLATSLGIDPLFIRLFFVLVALGDGIGVFLYILLWIIIPEEGKTQAHQGVDFSQRTHALGEDIRQAVRQPHPQAGLIAGGALIVVGVITLLRNLDISWLEWLDFNIFWPVLLIVGGVVWILRGLQGEKNG